MMTSLPSWMKRSARAMPMPDEPPVMSIVACQVHLFLQLLTEERSNGIRRPRGSLQAPDAGGKHVQHALQNAHGGAAPRRKRACNESARVVEQDLRHTLLSAHA